MVDDARPDIDIVEIHFLGIATREGGMKPEKTASTVGFVNTLCLNGIDSRIVVAGLKHPVALAVAVHLDGHRKRRRDVAVRASANALLTVGILAEQFDGVVATAFAEAQEIALRNLRQVSVICTKPNVRKVVSRRAERLANPKLPSMDSYSVKGRER